MKTKKFSIIICIIFRFSLSAQVSECNYTLKGFVKDSVLNEPLDFTNIEISGANNGSVNAGKNGEFIFKGLCPGKTEMHISHKHCEHLHFSFNITGDSTITVYLKHTEEEFDGIVYTVKAEKESTQSLLNQSQLAARRGSSISELMQDLGGVSLLRTGTNIAKPVINGLHSNRVIIVNNGVRQEGQNWGVEHAPEIDAFLASEIQLVKGVESLRYGADGIGGVILIRPVSLFREKSGEIKGDVFLVGSSNGRKGIVSGYAGTKISEKFPLFIRVQGTSGKGGNSRTSLDYLSNTASKENNFSINLGFQKKSLKSEFFYSRFYTLTGIYAGSHTGNISDLNAAIASDRPLIRSGFTYKIARPYQSVKHYFIKLREEYTFNAKTSAELILSYQKNHRSEFDPLRSQSSIKAPSFDYYLNTFSVDFSIARNNYHGISYKSGIYGMRQSNAFTGRFLIPGYIQDALAVYGLTWYNYFKNRFEAGLRYDIRNLESYLWNNNNLEISNKNFRDATYFLSFHHEFNKKSKVTIIHSSGWRSPSANELFINGFHQGLASVEIGDPDLVPERSFNQSATYSYRQKEIYFEIEAYYKYIKNFINLVPGIPTLTIQGAFPVYKFEQYNAEIYGINFSIKYDFANHFSSVTSAGLLAGNNIDFKEPLNMMPPNKFRTALGFDNKKFSIFINANYAARQNRYVINNDLKAPPDAYIIFGSDISYKLKVRKRNLNLNLGIRNAANQKYREYLNRFRYFMDEPGIDITLRINYNLNI